MSVSNDETLIAYFRIHAYPNESKSAQEGRPIYDEMEVVEIRAPGSMNTSVQPAWLQAGWVTDPQTGGQRRITYAERFSRQYRQFKEGQTQTKSGTPLTFVPFLTEARRAELRALNVLTVEQLALIDGQELKNLGPNGREFKNKAQEFLADAKRGAPNSMMVAEIEALRAKNETLAEDLERLKKADSTFDDMSDTQLVELIKSNTGHAPQGMPNRKTLVRMAAETRRSG